MNPRHNYMHVAPGFRAIDIGLSPSSLRDLYFHLTWKAEARNPRLTDMTEVRSGVWDRLNRAEVDASSESIKARVMRAAPRLARRREWIAAQNRATLAAMTEEQARASLESMASFSLKWHEQLPHGITPQEAADSTGLAVWREWWEGSHRFSRCYSRGNNVRKFHAVAKAI